ncbi:MAG: hypothetical protein ACRDFX_01930 [Chloroflexota bacterium]
MRTDEPPRPQAARGADLADFAVPKRTIFFCLSLTFLLYLSIIGKTLQYSNPPTGDQPFYLMDTISLVQDGDLNVANNYAAHDENLFYQRAPHPPGSVSIKAPYPLPPQLTLAPARPATEQYGYHPPGLGIALIPSWVVGSWFSLWWPATIVFMCLIAALLALNVFLLALQVTGRPLIAWIVWISLAFTSPLVTYSQLLFTELPVGLLMIWTFRRLAMGWHANGPLRKALLGASIAYIPWLSWRCVPIAGGLGAYAVYQYWQGRRNPDAMGTKPFDIAWFVAPIILSAGLAVWYSEYLFGVFWPNVVLQGSLAPVFHWPWNGGGELAAFVTGAFGLLFDRQWGLLPFTPVYLLSIVGIIALTRTQRSADRRLLLWAAVVTLPYACLISAFDQWNGLWCPPARYLTSLVPVLAAPLAMSLYALRNSHVFKALYGILAGIGFAFAAIMIHDPQLMFPQVRGNLLVWLADAHGLPFHLNLQPLIPAFAWPDLLNQPIITGRIIVLACLLVLFGASLLGVEHGRRWATGGSWFAAFGVVAAAWFAMNYQFLQHRTVLDQVARWQLSPAPVQPSGALFAGGRLYISDYRGGTIGVLDPTSGAYRLVKPSLAGKPLSFAHPGALSAGPNHTLYVLNNGPGRRALFLMRPNGAIIQRQALAGTVFRVGMAVQRHGSLVISDMKGGSIRTFLESDGVPQHSWGGVSGRFNNVAGIAIGPGGTIFAAEMSANRIQELTRSGAFVRSWNLACVPQQITRSDPPWLEVSCGSGLVSLNTRTGALQQSRVDATQPPLVAPTGIAYGSDHLLYVVDGNTVVAYRVTH